jgi:hypothetical protein
MEGIIRPESNVLPESSLIPAQNLISPPPNQFTHELERWLPFFYTTEGLSHAPDGHLPAGTKVALLVDDGGGHCRVVDGQGLYVEVEHAGLKRL